MYKASAMPKVVYYSAIIALIVNICMVFYGGWVTGTSYDEPIHLLRLQSYLDTGWYLPGWQMLNGAPVSANTTAYVYGPVASLFAQFVANMIGVGDFIKIVPINLDIDSTVASAELYAARHIAVGMMSILGLISVACIVKIILKSWQWGVLAAAILSSIPLWTGHAMINIKDTPVAVGVSVFVLGLIVLVQEDFFQKKKLLWVGIVSLVAGSVLAIGTRIGIWPFLAAFTMFAIGADTLMRRYRFGLTGLNGFDFKKICVCVVTQCLAYLLLLIIYPKIFSSPVRMVWFSVKSSSKYDWPGMSLTAGVFHSQPPPFWYAPAWLTHQIPVLILLLALLGVVLSIRHLAGRHKYVFLKINYQVIARNSGITTASVGIVLMFALFALFAVIAVKANLYGGIRHLLFIIPAWAILATLGYWFVLQFAVNVSHSKKCLVFLSNTTCVLALLLPTLDQSRLFPYNLIYFNEIATLRAIKNRWPSDSWYTSSKELALNLNSKEEVYCFDYARGMPLLEKNQVLKSSLVKNCNLAYLKPYLKPNSMREETVQPSSESILLVAPEAIGGRISAFCQLHSQVTRPLRSQTLVISDAHLCAADSLKLQ